MISNGAVIAAVLATAAAIGWAQSPSTAPAAQPAASQPAGTQPALTKTEADRIAALIVKMGSPKFPDRQQAQNALVQIGAPAESALHIATTHSSNSEVRRRATAAIDRIEASRPDAPTFVSVQANREKSGRVLASMADQAGISISPRGDDFWNGNDNPEAQKSIISLSLGRVPLLVALEQFCKATQTCPISNGNANDAFTLNRGPCGPWNQQDRMAVIANGITQTRQIQFGDDSTNRSDVLSLTFLIDPKRPLVDHQPPKVTKAVDENGVSLGNAGTPDGTMGDALQGTCCFDADVPLNFPAQHGKMLADLQGTILMRIATKTQTIVIPDLAKAAKGAGVAACDRKLEVVSFAFASGSGNVNFRVTNTMPQNILMQMESKGQPIDLGGEFRSCHLVDANGTALWFDNTTCDSGDRQLNWQGHFTVNNSPPLKPPFSLRWDVVAATKDITVPFEFKNLPLPQP